MSEMSDLKKFVLGLSDRDLMGLLGMPDYENKKTKEIDVPGKIWYEQALTGLNKEGERRLAELKKQLENPGTAHFVDKKQVRYLEQLKKMHMDVPAFFKNTVNPKALYRHLVDFCITHDIPEEIVASVVPVLITYIETGHMRPIIFVGEKGCGKTTAAKLLIEEALKIPVEVIKIPQANVSHGMTGECGTFQSADLGWIAKSRIRANTFIYAIIFDEIDKVSHVNNRANVDDELLSITDESCEDITDNYLETTIVGLQFIPMFFTANDLQKVSPTLVDRCTVIRFPNATSTRIKSISRKYVDKQLASSLYNSIRFDYELMEKHIDNLVRHDVTSLRKHQQMIESVLRNALNVALLQDTDEIVSITEEMYTDAEQAILGTVKLRTGFC